MLKLSGKWFIYETLMNHLPSKYVVYYKYLKKYVIYFNYFGKYILELV